MRVSCGTAAWRETPPAVFDSMAGAQYRAILGAGAHAVRRLVATALCAWSSEQNGHVWRCGCREIRLERLNGTEPGAVAVKEDVRADSIVAAPARRFTSRRQTFCKTRRCENHPRARARPMLLLFRRTSTRAVPGPRRAAVHRGAIPTQPGLKLHRMQLAEREKPADDFLRWLYREGHLNAADSLRASALEALPPQAPPSLP